MSDISVLQTVEHKNLGEIVYQKIAEALMRGKFAPGTRLTIRELSVSLGTSVTPVRDAILRLIQDDALIQKTPREVRVPLLTPQRYTEIRDIRVRLEGLALRNATIKATQHDMKRLWLLIEQNEAALHEERWQDALECNQLFHCSFADIAEMPSLTAIICRLWLQMGPLIAGAYQHGGRMMIEDHYSVMKAIEARDPDAAEAAIVKDILDASELMLARVQILQNQ